MISEKKHYRAGGNIEAQYQTPSIKTLHRRNLSRNLEVILADRLAISVVSLDNSPNSQQSSLLKINAPITNKGQYAVAKTTDGQGVFITNEENRPIVFSIFHEFCHYFHALKNPEQYLDDKTFDINEAFISGLPSWLFEELKENGKASTEKLEKSLEPFLKNGKYFQQEEFKTICGVPFTLPTFCFGDEHCENSFVACYNKVRGTDYSLRYGHKDFPFVEDYRIVQKLFALAKYDSSEAGDFGLSHPPVSLPQSFYNDNAEGIGFHRSIDVQKYKLNPGAKKGNINVRKIAPSSRPRNLSDGDAPYIGGREEEEREE